MRFVVLVLLLLGAHFCLTAFAPAQAGRAWVLWPFAADSKPVFAFVGGLPAQSGSAWTPLLAGMAGLAFLLAAAGLFGLVIPTGWWSTLVLIGVTSSLLLNAAYFSGNAIVPLLVDLTLLWGVWLQHWTVAGLRAA
jgi:hypothetical protein